MKRVAIVQSNYIPWKGYFDLIASVDEFIIYDSVQFTRRDWRNRNLIKTPTGVKWLTVPIVAKGRFEQTIKETLIDGDIWRKKHWKSLLLNYAKADHFRAAVGVLEPIYQINHKNLSDLNRVLIEAICGFVGIETRILDSSQYEYSGDKSERLVMMCKAVGAQVYVSGPSAMSYIDKRVFEREGISIEWFSYEGYPEYGQLWGGFVENISVVDLMFNCGARSREFIVRERHR